LEVGSEVAFFKTFTNVPLKREDKNVYLLSAGVGLATFRPLVLNYFNHPDHIKHMHSLNIDSSKDFLFTDVFEEAADKGFTSEFVDNRKGYYEKVRDLAADQEGIFYVVGSMNSLYKTLKCYVNKGYSQSKLCSTNEKRSKRNILRRNNRQCVLIFVLCKLE